MSQPFIPKYTRDSRYSRSKFYIIPQQYHFRFTRLIHFPLLLRRASTTKAATTRAPTLAVFPLLELFIKSFLCNLFLDSDLFQLKWQPMTTSLRYVSKFPPFNYQSLLCIFLFLKFISFGFLGDEK